MLEQSLVVNRSEAESQRWIHTLLPSCSLQVTIADDYSDPFDAKNDLKNKAGKGESAGYMEPYEAQRIMTGKQSCWHRDSAGRQRGRSWQVPSQPQQGKVCTCTTVVGG